MPDPAERFLTAATAPLGDNAELQVVARRELEECLVDGEAGALAEAAERLEATGTSAWPLRSGLFILTAIVSIIVLGVSGRTAILYKEAKKIADPFSSGSSSEERAEAYLSRDLTAAQRLLLLGDTSKSLPSDRMKALWDSDPGNPAYFADYSIRFIRGHNRLPPDFLATAAKLDPDNAWFTITAAGVGAKGAVEKKTLSTKARKAGALDEYTILDRARLDETLRLLAKAAAQTRFGSYQADLLEERIRLLPGRTDVASQLVPLSFVARLPSSPSGIVDLSRVVDAAASFAERDRDPDGFRKLAASWEPCLEMIVRDKPGSLIDQMVRDLLVSITSKRFDQTARSLGLEDEMQKWGSRRERLESIREERRDLDSGDGIKLRASMLAGLTVPVLSSRTVRARKITDEQLTPGRIADHELFSRLAAAAVWMLLGSMLTAAVLYRFRGSVLVRRLSPGMAKLMLPADWTWILGAGVVLPFLFYLAIYRLTPLGARDWSIAASAFLVPSGQVAAMGFLMIVLPVLVARWRLGKRGAMLGWRKGRAWMGWTAVICGAISLPVFGLSFANGKGSEAVMMTAAALLGILVLTWLVIGIRAVFSKRPALLRRVTLSRVLVPAYALGMLLMAASMPLYHAAEKRWLAQDRLMEITPEAPALSRYEWEVAQAMRAELLEILNTK